MSLSARNAAPIRMAARTLAIPLTDEETASTISLKPEYLLPSGSSKDRVPFEPLGRARGCSIDDVKQ